MSDGAPRPAAPAFLAASMYGDEQRRRRLVLIGVATLLLSSLSPIFGHHLSAHLDAALIGRDHVLGVCLIALHALIGPVHDLFHLLLVAGIVYAVTDRVRAAQRLKRALALLPIDTSPRQPLDRLVRETGLHRDQVCIVGGLPNPAFTAGWFQPRVYLAGSVCDALSPAELRAVLQHEASHVWRRDPLRLSLMRFVACLLFWIPAFRRLADDLADESEIIADDAAAREQPLALASAILALASWRRTDTGTLQLLRLSPGDIAGLVLSDAGGASPFDALLDRRVRRLAGESVRWTSHVTRRSVVGAALTVAVVWITGIVVAHPMPMAHNGERARHCDHRGLSALTHLFCIDGHAHPTSAAADADACPHALAHT
jgi:Zn-dependent protease with chaperone function